MFAIFTAAKGGRGIDRGFGEIGVDLGKGDRVDAGERIDAG